MTGSILEQLKMRNARWSERCTPTRNPFSEPLLPMGLRPGARALAVRGVAQEVLLLQALPQGLAVLRRMGLEQLAAAAPAVVAGVMEMRRRNHLHLLWIEPTSPTEPPNAIL